MAIPIQLVAIVACTDVGAIGRNNTIPWYIREDLKRFKQLTNNGILIMGRKTYDSLPGGGPLPDRIHFVVTRDEALLTNVLSPRNVTFVPDVLCAMEEATNLAAIMKHTQVYCIGGGDIYQQMLPYVHIVELTLVYCKIPDADAFYPLDRMLSDDMTFSLQEQSSIRVVEDSDIAYSFRRYVNAHPIEQISTGYTQ